MSEVEYVNMKCIDIHRRTIPALDEILDTMTLPEIIKLMASRVDLRNYIAQNDRVKMIIKDRSLNMDVFYGMFGLAEIRQVHNALPEIETLKINLSYAPKQILNEIRRFHYLKKLYLAINERKYNIEDHAIIVNYLKIKMQFTDIKADPLSKIINNFRCMDKYSQIGGVLTESVSWTLSFMELRCIKLQDVTIQTWKNVRRMILMNKNLIELKLFCINYNSKPCMIRIATDIINYLKIYNLQLRKFTFCLDQSNNTNFTALNCLRKLKFLRVYYNVQDDTKTLDKLIEVVSAFQGIHVEFIEYLKCSSSTGYKKHEMLKFAKMSRCYSDVISKINHKVTVSEWIYATY